MATIIIDQNAEYTWEVDNDLLKKVLDFVMRRLDPRSAFHELLFASKNYGNLSFYQLGTEQKDIFQTHILEYQSQEGLSEEEQKGVKRLVDMLEFSKNFDLETV